jgi:anthranilate phosphoribosyltransferase
MPDVKDLIARLAEGHVLTREESVATFEAMADGEVTPAQAGALLMAFRQRGETVEEITGAALAMRRRMAGVAAPAEAVDVVGTGGDGSQSLNVSTCTAFVVAGAGVPVAKHGNRAQSSRCGAADVLEALGVSVDVTPDHVSRCIQQAGIGFMFAPHHHPALARIGLVRRELGTRTVFNLLGPMLNPAGVTRHLVGVFAPQWVEPVARVLGQLGSASAMVVHGSGGLDEITLSGPTLTAVLSDGDVRVEHVGPDDFGLDPVPDSALRGADAGQNAKALRAVLDGAPGPYREVVLANAAAALVVAGVAGDLRSGVDAARVSLDSGAALRCLTRLVAVSNAPASDGRGRAFAVPLP